LVIVALITSSNDALVDILLTDDLKPKLIEVNLGPSLGVQCLTDRIVKEVHFGSHLKRFVISS
jgi:hypothetical protein